MQSQQQATKNLADRISRSRRLRYQAGQNGNAVNGGATPPPASSPEPPVAKTQASPAGNAHSTMQSKADKRKALAKAHMRSTSSVQSFNSGEDDTKAKQQASSSTSTAAASLAEKRRRAMSRVGPRAGASPGPEEVPKGPEAPNPPTPKSNSLLSKLSKKSMSQSRRSGASPASPATGASDPKKAPPSKAINARDSAAMRAALAAAHHQQMKAPATPNMQQPNRGPMMGGQVPVQHPHQAPMNRAQPPPNMTNQGRMQQPQPQQYNGVQRSPSASPPQQYSEVQRSPSASPPQQYGGLQRSPSASPPSQMGQPRTPMQPPHHSPNPSPPRNSPPQIVVGGGPVPTRPAGNNAKRMQPAPMMQNPNHHQNYVPPRVLSKEESEDSGGPSDEEREESREEKKEDGPTRSRNHGIASDMKPRHGGAPPPTVQGSGAPMPMSNQPIRSRSPAPMQAVPGQSPVPIRGMSPGRNFRNQGQPPFVANTSAATPPRPIPSHTSVSESAQVHEANRNNATPPPPPPHAGSFRGRPAPSTNIRARSPSPFGPRVRARSPSPSVVSTASGSSVMGRAASSKQSAVVVSQPIGQPDLELLSPKDNDGPKHTDLLGDGENEEEPNRSPPRIIHQRRRRSNVPNPAGPTAVADPISMEDSGQDVSQPSQKPSSFSNQATNGQSFAGNMRAASQPRSIQHNNALGQGVNPQQNQMRSQGQSNFPMRQTQNVVSNNEAISRSPSAPRPVQDQESSVEKSLPMADGRATLEIPRAASVSRFKAQFERPGNVALIPDRTLLQSQTRTPNMYSNGASVPEVVVPATSGPSSQTPPRMMREQQQNQPNIPNRQYQENRPSIMNYWKNKIDGPPPGNSSQIANDQVDAGHGNPSQGRKWTPNRSSMGEVQNEQHNHAMHYQTSHIQVNNSPGQDAAMQVPVQGNDRAVIETPRRVNVANMAGRFQQSNSPHPVPASPGQQHNQSGAPQMRNFSPSPNNRWRQPSPSPNQRNLEQARMQSSTGINNMAPPPSGGSSNSVSAGPSSGGMQATPGRMQAQQQANWKGPQQQMPHSAAADSASYGQMRSSQHQNFMPDQGSQQHQPMSPDLVQTRSDDPSSAMAQTNQMSPSARMVGPSRSVADFRSQETELAPPDLSIAADSISNDHTDSTPPSSAALRSPSQAERLAAKERAGTIQHSFTADGALPPMNRASNPKQNRSRAAAQPLPAQARSKDAYNELQKKLMKRQQDIETTSVASTPMMQNLTAEVARATAVVMSNNERPMQNSTYDQPQSPAWNERNHTVDVHEENSQSLSTPNKKGDGIANPEGKKGSPKLVQLAADSVHAVDYDQASYDALRSQSPSMEADNTHSSIPDESSLPPEFTSSASNSQSAPPPPPPMHSNQQPRQSDTANPATSGTLGIEESGLVTPTIADRAKAIAMWKGGKGPKPKTADLVERPRSGDSNEAPDHSSGPVANIQSQGNQKNAATVDDHFWNSSGGEDSKELSVQGDMKVHSGHDPFSPSAMVGFKESTGTSNKNSGFDPFSVPTNTTNSDDSGFPSGGDDGFGFGNVNSFGVANGFDQTKKNPTSNGTAFSDSSGFSEPFIAARDNAFADDFVASGGFSSGSGSDPFTETPIQQNQNSTIGNAQGTKPVMLKPNKGDSSSGAAARRRSRGTPRNEDKIFGKSKGLMIDDGFGAQPPADTNDDGFGIPTKKSHSFGSKKKGFTMTAAGDDGFGTLNDGFRNTSSENTSFATGKAINDDGFGFSTTDFGGSNKNAGAGDPGDDLFMPSSSSSEKPHSDGFPIATGQGQANQNVVLRSSNRDTGRYDSEMSQPNLDHFYTESSVPDNTWSFGTGIESSFFDKHKTKEATIIPATIGEEV